MSDSFWRPRGTGDDLPSTGDPRVRTVWTAFKERGWIINSLKMAQVAVAALEGREDSYSQPCPDCGSLHPLDLTGGYTCAAV